MSPTTTVSRCFPVNPSKPGLWGWTKGGADTNFGCLRGNCVLRVSELGNRSQQHGRPRSGAVIVQLQYTLSESYVKHPPFRCLFCLRFSNNANRIVSYRDAAKWRNAWT